MPESLYNNQVSHPKLSFISGVQAGIPIALGYLPVALTYGLLAKNTGLTFMEASGMSLFVFAGASQFMALQMIAVGTSSLEIILATFIINIRHFLMSASINERTGKDHPVKKLIYAFGITDETFSVASLYRGRLNAPFMFGLVLTAYGSWVLCSIAGYTLGASLPQILQDSMGIALYALFIGLIVPSLKKHLKIVWLFLLSACLNTCGAFFLSSGWSIVLSTLISALIIESFYIKRRVEQ